MRRWVQAIVAALVLATGSLPLDAARWVTLGQRAVNDRLDHDSIAVGARDGDFVALKIQVRRAAVDFHKVVVHFGNGQTHEAEVRSTIRAGGESRAIDLPGRDRVIERVEFWYDAKTSRGRKATIVLLGQH